MTEQHQADTSAVPEPPTVQHCEKNGWHWYVEGTKLIVCGSNRDMIERVLKEMGYVVKAD